MWRYIYTFKERIYVNMTYIIPIIAIVLGVALDQYTKALAVKHLADGPIPLIEGVFELKYLENRGAAFGMLQNQQTFFLIVTIITLILMTILYIRMPHTKRFLPLRICLVSIVAGAIGNMIDRVTLKYVIDFFYFKLIDFPIFNVADIFATCASILLILLLFVYYKEEDIDEIYKAIKR